MQLTPMIITKRTLGRPLSINDISLRLQDFLHEMLATFPWQINVQDWVGREYSLGGNANHWRNLPLNIHIKSENAGKDLLSLNVIRFLERFVEGEVDMWGNMYLLSDIRCHANLVLSPWWVFLHAIPSGALLFQNMARAKNNVKSHYDIPQEVLNIYLDNTYKSYSCGMFENPEKLDLEELIKSGTGELDTFDSLEKAQWKKYKDAVDFINPGKGETLLDIGCGYGGQLHVALEDYPFGKVVGWTHSENQVIEGRKLFLGFNKNRWELNEGDYREENRVFDHVTSTGMVSHVGPRGLGKYVKNVRTRIKKGGHYVHHALMKPYTGRPLDSEIGISFNKKYVWPGFHWFPLEDHIAALSENKFEVIKVINLSTNYAKTTAAWYERLMENKDIFIGSLGSQTFRAWQIYLAGGSGFLNGKTCVYRIYSYAR